MTQLNQEQLEKVAQLFTSLREVERTREAILNTLKSYGYCGCGAKRGLYCPNGCKYNRKDYEGKI